MKKKAFVPIIVVLILATFTTAWYFTPKTFATEEKVDDMPDDAVNISIDGVTYFGIGLPIPVEPDESVIEYVEIPAGHGDVTITAFARMEEGKMIACLIDGEWYRFHSMEALASSQVNLEN